MKLSDKLTSIDYNRLARDIRARVEKEGKRLSVTGTATFAVTYTVRASVEVPFEDVEVADSSPIGVKTDDDAGTLVIFARDVSGLPKVTKEELEQNVVDDIYHDIPEDLSDYHVEVDDVEVEEYDLYELRLDPPSEKAVIDWNGAEE